MKTFLLALGFCLICASSQINPAEINGDWHTVYMAANNVEKINEHGELRVYFRHFECSHKCNELKISLFDKLSGECQKVSLVGKHTTNDVYETEYSGENFFAMQYISNGTIAFYNANVDGQLLLTHVTFLIAKGAIVSEEEQKKFEELTVQKEIPKENIRNVIETDDCPAA